MYQGGFKAFKTQPYRTPWSSCSPVSAESPVLPAAGASPAVLRRGGLRIPHKHPVGGGPHPKLELPLHTLQKALAVSETTVTPEAH